ncbi:hypothetical protein LR48_Vigan03g106100 [Vigna angularis]|uniref:Uncharacterized protein n=1 Tax=Phaseolus angularis TaxID=3914 RepID=A0A0L9U5H9_PHAAN|nr:hypothetical protein LR48_Vigan03g106100 [Vigna angularis]
MERSNDYPLEHAMRSHGARAGFCTETRSGGSSYGGLGPRMKERNNDYPLEHASSKEQPTWMGVAMRKHPARTRRRYSSLSSTGVQLGSRGAQKQVLELAIKGVTFSRHPRKKGDVCGSRHGRLLLRLQSVGCVSAWSCSRHPLSFLLSPLNIWEGWKCEEPAVTEEESTATRSCTLGLSRLQGSTFLLDNAHVIGSSSNSLLHLFTLLSF